MTSLMRAFAEALTAWPADEPAVVERARLLVLDGLAVAVAGAGERGPSILADAARADGSRAVATVIGHGFATRPVQAARVNGASMHVLDFEPMWFPPNHALSTVLPAVLALAEEIEAETGQPQGLAVMSALARGVEAQGRLRVSSGQLEPATLTLHPPGAVGSLAAAAAAASLLGLDVDGTATAIGIAASRLGGVLANVGSMTKALHCGDAAANGLEAALLAKAGFTADADSIGGDRGWGRSLFGERFDPSALDGPVTTPRIIDPGPAWKLFPSQYATHFGITAALDARAEVPDPGAIASVLLRVPNMPYIDRPSPASGLAGKFSWQYTAAAALLDGEVTPASFTDARRHAPDMERLLPRVGIAPDPGISGRFDEMHVRIEVTRGDGPVVSRTCEAPAGNWRRPVGAEPIERKARGLLEDVLGPEGAGQLLAALEVEPAALDIRGVMRLIAARPAAH